MSDAGSESWSVGWISSCVDCYVEAVESASLASNGFSVRLVSKALKPADWKSVAGFRSKRDGVFIDPVPPIQRFGLASISLYV
jgi:hypothetical protein